MSIIIIAKCFVIFYLKINVNYGVYVITLGRKLIHSGTAVAVLCFWRYLQHVRSNLLTYLLIYYQSVA